jgi:uncharacterized Zn-finger protein
VTCEAEAEGLRRVAIETFDVARRMQEHLDAAGVEAHVERVPPARPEERHHPRWNVYVPADAVPAAAEALRERWGLSVDAPGAEEAAARGREQIDVDAGGEVTCPACGHRFTLPPGGGECPDCGLALGVA